MLWQQSLTLFLSANGFQQASRGGLLWIKPSAPANSVQGPWSEPSESATFLDSSLQLVLKLFPVEAYRSKHSDLKDLSDLQLFRRLITDSVDSEITFSLRTLFRQQFTRRLLPSRQRTMQATEVSTASVQRQFRDGEATQPSTIVAPVSASIRGHVDGFHDDLSLRGWVDASSYGTDPSTVRVYWQERDDLLVGEGPASQPRPDLIDAGLTAVDCGFAVNVSIVEGRSMHDLLDLPVTLKVVESKSGALIGGCAWPVTDAIKATLLSGLVSSQLEQGQGSAIQNYLATSTRATFLRAVRQRLLEHSILSCFAGEWNDLPIQYVVAAVPANPILDYGVESEAARRIELVFLATRRLLSEIDGEDLHSIDVNHCAVDLFDAEPHHLLQQLNERCFLGLQGWENRLWQTYLRPLIDVLIGTFFLQRRPRPLGDRRALLEALARVAETVYADLPLASYLRSILAIDQDYSLDDRHAALAFKAGDCFTYLMAAYAKARQESEDILDLEYFASVVGFVDKSPALLQVLLHRIRSVLPQYLTDHPRQSRPRHWVDNLGFLVNSSTQHLVSLMVQSGLSSCHVRRFHQQMIDAKRTIAETLWLQSGECNAPAERPLKRWLIVGEPELRQCWMYRIEQKFAQLTSLGAEVRCLDHQDLKSWSFSHHVQWADAIVVCRLAATYSVFRAMAFARHCGKRIFSEIDDLIFTPDYPAPYESYGGSISKHQFRNLSIDYPLRQAVLAYSDDVIVSTQVLADVCIRDLNLDAKRIHVLPNLPLAELNSVAANHVKQPPQVATDHRIVVSSGTLSHKQIFNELIVPVLETILQNHPQVSLTIIGHFERPSLIARYSDQLSILPFSDYADYLKVLESASIALVPLEIHPTTQAKSAIKWMEASLCGVVSICSPVRAYTDVVQDGHNGLIAETADQWLQAIERLIGDSELYSSLQCQAFDDARRMFSQSTADALWSQWVSPGQSQASPVRRREKILVINVFFAPQSIGGATRVAQDYVDDLLNDPSIDYDITVLCTDYDHWQSDPPSIAGSLDSTEQIEEDLAAQGQSFTASGSTAKQIAQLRGQLIAQQTDYKDAIGLDVSYWKGVRVVRLCLPPKPWPKHEDPLIEEFCEEFFAQERFDRVQCHCCQLLTASPLVVARRLGIPYEIVLHDAWWMSVEQFLVAPSGRVLDPADPLAHFDHPPTDQERTEALARRDSLYELLSAAEHRWAVSQAFQRLCANAGVADVEVRENRFVSMANDRSQKRMPLPVARQSGHCRVCHIGGMSLHKGYQLFRRAVHELPRDLPLMFTVVDHRLGSSRDHYQSTWNGYQVSFVAPIPMDLMAQFYAQQDVLIAPSIWPESFGLVTREALSAGLWVIASDAGALAEPIKASLTPVGTVVRPNDLQELRDALIAAPDHLAELEQRSQS
ncbi:MAG: glycosyltransferase [Synechococcus sp.]